MNQSVVEKAVAQLTEAGLVNPGAFKGCTPEEIGQIEAKFHLQLPAIYKEFLVRMGKAAGQFLIGSDYLFPASLRFRDDAATVLEQEGSGFKLDENDFVFMGRQVTSFCSLGLQTRPIRQSFSSWKGKSQKGCD